MDISIFEVLGPVMIGPSSSHTAGAARLARISAVIAGKPFSKVTFGLHGSFAHTYKGHGTDMALLGGVLGIREDDERLRDAYEIAKERGLEYEFYEKELENVHENSVLITFYCCDGSVANIVGSSIGGGQINICRINEFDTEFHAQAATLLISHYDHKGVISKISGILSEADVNIAVMKLNRRSKGDVAFCTIETDDEIGENVVSRIREIEDVITVRALELTQ
ncbi:MAG TPA: L-serine ammonia-lyase, iron-sulfur-dependent, subunit beta [Candidatus Scybalocola faecigallinarum]|uniref:L-serine deaminase n=1 Tax=Candidatus Scybalocola faecigallinarum TaxID=2840941 RepID=A0A9D1F5R7_9FIRM|nr:L-serine ammonia-lyase, iron-sulfur-dependent, subunit beta [Candidatus Scybalocola faecigallinarum]